MTQKEYRVLITPFPTEIEVMAEDEAQALQIAKTTFNRSVWEAEVIEVID